MADGMTMPGWAPPNEWVMQNGRPVLKSQVQKAARDTLTAQNMRRAGLATGTSLTNAELAAAAEPDGAYGGSSAQAGLQSAMSTRGVPPADSTVDTTRGDFLRDLGWGREDTLRNQAWSREDMLRAEREAANKRDFEMRLAAMRQAMEGGRGTAHVTGGGEADSTAAENIVMNRAKDRIGLSLRGHLTALRNAMGARGVVAGSPVEQGGIADVLAGGAGEMADTNREVALQGLMRARQVADRNYQGQITQRGQDLSQMANLLQLIQGGGRVY